MRMRERPADQGRRAATFWEPVLQMQTALIGFARGLVGDDELARDIVQDAFVDAWRAASRDMPPFDAPNPSDDLTGIRRWLFTVAYRHAIKHLRRRKSIVWESLDAREATAPTLLRAPLHFEDALAEAETLRIALQAVEPVDAACCCRSFTGSAPPRSQRFSICAQMPCASGFHAPSSACATPISRSHSQRPCHNHMSRARGNQDDTSNTDTIANT